MAFKKTEKKPSKTTNTDLAKAKVKSAEESGKMKVKIKGPVSEVKKVIKSIVK